MWVVSYLHLYIVCNVPKISGEFKVWFSLSFTELVTSVSY